MNEDATNSATRPGDEPLEPAPPSTAQLAWLRDRSAGNDGLLASTLRRHREAEGWTHEDLASHLGLTPEELDRLGLAGQPRTDQFAADVRAIARANGVNDMQLLHIIRAVQSRNAFRGSAAARGFVAAARDHDEPEPEPDERPHDQRPDPDRPEDTRR